ncbi:hypothetical protein TNCV_4739861 [Trichonephila clavipes]|nr:hypothetical protein TNCV_4739861 [Trichonephila clavipes]
MLRNSSVDVKKMQLCPFTLPHKSICTVTATPLRINALRMKLTLKSLVYADKPQTLDHLEDNIRRVIADIRPQMLEKVIENWTSRLDYIRASRGSPMPEIIFKISEIVSKQYSISHQVFVPSFLSGKTAQGGPWPSQEVFSRPAFFLPVFSNS